MSTQQKRQRPAELANELAITPEWLSHLVGRANPHLEVTTCVVDRVIHGTSTQVRFHVEYNHQSVDAGTPHQLVLKGGFEPHSTVMGNEQMYLLEMRFYRDIAGWVKINAPLCLYADEDGSSGHPVVILEDLRVRGVAFCDAFTTQSYSEVARRLDAMARYHAQTWDTPEFAQGGRLSWVPARYESDRGVQQLQHYLSEDVWNGFMRLPRGAAVPRALRDREQLAEALRNMALAHKSSNVCLIHGDTHLGNLYVDADGAPGFLDPQVARAPWSMEVAYHLVGGLEVVDRRAWERPLLAFYLECLRRYNVEPPSFEEAWAAYCRDICHGLYVWLKNEDVYQSEAVNTANAMRFGQAATDCGTMRLLT